MGGYGHHDRLPCAMSVERNADADADAEYCILLVLVDTYKVQL